MRLDPLGEQFQAVLEENRERIHGLAIGDSLSEQLALEVIHRANESEFWLKQKSDECVAAGQPPPRELVLALDFMRTAQAHVSLLLAAFRAGEAKKGGEE